MRLSRSFAPETCEKRLDQIVVPRSNEQIDDVVERLFSDSFVVLVDCETVQPTSGFPVSLDRPGTVAVNTSIAAIGRLHLLAIALRRGLDSLGRHSIKPPPTPQKSRA